MNDKEGEDARVGVVLENYLLHMMPLYHHASMLVSAFSYHVHYAVG